MYENRGGGRESYREGVRGCRFHVHALSAHTHTHGHTHTYIHTHTHAHTHMHTHTHLHTCMCVCMHGMHITICKCTGTVATYAKRDLSVC